MSDSAPIEIVTLPKPGEFPQLPEVATNNNLEQFSQFMRHTGEYYVRGAFRVGNYILDEKPDLTTMVLKYDFSPDQLKSWKSFARLCRANGLSEDQLFTHGTTLSGIAKALKSPTKEKGPKKKSNSDRLKDLESTVQDQTSKIEDLTKALQEKDEKIKSLEKSKPSDALKKQYLSKLREQNERIKLQDKQLEDKNREIAKLKSQLQKPTLVEDEDDDEPLELML